MTATIRSSQEDQRRGARCHRARMRGSSPNGGWASGVAGALDGAAGAEQAVEAAGVEVRGLPSWWEFSKMDAVCDGSKRRPAEKTRPVYAPQFRRIMQLKEWRCVQ